MGHGVEVVAVMAAGTRSGSGVRSEVLFGILHSLVASECVRPLQRKDRTLPRLAAVRSPIVPDHKLAATCRATKPDPRPFSVQDMKPLLKLRAARTSGEDHRQQLQASVNRIDQYEVDSNSDEDAASHLYSLRCA